MSKKQGILLVAFPLLIVLFGILLFSFTKRPVKQHSFAELLPSTKTKPKSLASLTLLPNPLIASPGAAPIITVVIDAQNIDKAPSLIQLEIGYDPTVLLEPEIKPGDFFTNPRVVLATINQNTGRISYALESDKASKQTGTVAVLTFFLNPYAVAKQTQLTFLAKTAIKDADGVSLLGQTHGTTIMLGNKEKIIDQIQSKKD